MFIKKIENLADKIKTMDNQPEVQSLLQSNYEGLMKRNILKNSAEYISKFAELLMANGLNQQASELFEHLRKRDNLLTVMEVINIYQGPAKGKKIVFLGAETHDLFTGKTVIVPVQEYVFPNGAYQEGKALSVLPKDAVLVHEFFKQFAHAA